MGETDRIEREIAEEREKLAQSLHAIDERLSPDAIVSRASDALRRQGGRVGDVAARNPLAIALIGTGLAWLAASENTSPPASPDRRDADDGADRDHDPAAADYDPRVKPTAAGLSQPTPPMAGVDDRIAAADRAMKRTEHEGDEIMSMTGTGYSETQTGFAQPQGRRERLRANAEEMRARLHDGLDNMSDKARARILSARLAAIEAQSNVERQIMRGSDNVRRTARDNPLLIGAVAFGLGAALAAAMPRTSVENRTIGARRDALLDEADRVFREETAKLRSVAEAAVEEGKSAVKDTLRTGPPTEDDPAERVREAAKGEARRQGVGKVN